MRASWWLCFAVASLAGASAMAQPLPAGTGRLRNRAQGMCLDVEGWNAQGNGNVHLWECNDDPDQVWSFARGSELVNSVGGVCLERPATTGAQAPTSTSIAASA